MIHVNIDTVIDKNVLGFEIGTRTDFDHRHGLDPLWVFLDYDYVKYRIKLADFLQTPTNFCINKYNSLQKKKLQTS